ncbi:flagellar hook-associated protein FlgK [Nocardioides yefusunii]|uniref:Flagellar hook-associated protein 1 n=1 Tax=Nocardioides yefusunii TaxID=2500546 RepID=A0ABW1R0I0_9ACTN|nr:flagellar hook-associated protein FlgK [Nocardioides yefusunii]
MSGTFSSFNTALGALNYNRTLMDVASSNIANATTPGYARRRVEGETVNSVGQAALWSRPDDPMVGEGVQAGSVSRIADAFLDARSRYEHGTNSYLSTRAESLTRLETGVGEPGDTGVSAALNSFRSGWHDLANSPDGAAARSQIIDRATLLAEAVGAQNNSVVQEEKDQKVRLDAMVTEVNTLAADLASTNKSIAIAGFSGSDPNVLLDQRDQLSLRLAQLTGGTATQRADGGFDFAVGGVSLVDGMESGTFAVVGGAATSAPVGTPVAFTVTAGGTSTAVPAGIKGEIGATAELLTETLPAYRESLGEVVRALATQINTQHAAGFDQNGDVGGDFFTFDPADPAGTLKVAFSDTAKVAASAYAGGGFDGSNASKLADTSAAEDAYQKLVNSLGSTVASAKRLTTNQQALTDQVDNAREQMSGVSNDEELVNMVAAQRSYEAASRIMSTLDSMLDTLINRTGLVGR